MCESRLLIGCQFVSSQLNHTPFSPCSIWNFQSEFHFWGELVLRLLYYSEHFPYLKQNFLRKWFLVLQFSPIDNNLSNPYTKHAVYYAIWGQNIWFLKIFLDFFVQFVLWPISLAGGTFWILVCFFLGVIIWIIQTTPVRKAQMTLEFFNTSDWNSDWKNNQLYVT